jgi:hypothetical protein
MASPLQKFSAPLMVAVPFLEPRRDDASEFWGLSRGKDAFEKVLQAWKKRWQHLNVVVKHAGS